jgi:hypothetical protein
MTSPGPAPREDSRLAVAAPSPALVHTPEEAARIIGADCKASWLRTKARKGEIPSLWIGKYGFTDAHITEIIRICERPARMAKPAAAAVPPAKSPAKRAATPPAPRALPAGVTLIEIREPRKRKVA